MPRFKHRYLLLSLFWSIPASITVDFLGHHNLAWDYWDNPKFSSSGLELYGIPLESFIWGDFFWLFHLTFYSIFFDKHKIHHRGRGEKVVLTAFSILSMIIWYLLNTGVATHIPFYYSVLIAICLAFNVFIYSLHKNLLSRLIKYSAVVFALGMIVEITSIKLELWTFNSTEYLYIIFGIPIEEIAWWFIVPQALILVHEMVDDSKD